MSQGSTFRAMRHRNYRLYVIGQSTSVGGTWMQTVGQGWLVLNLTNNNGLVLGLVTASQYIPTLLLGLWGGVLADRLDKRRLLIATQTSMAIAAGLLAVATLTDVVAIWMVVVCAVVTGTATAIDTPSRMAFVNEMVPREDLANAVSLNSAGYNLGRMIGPVTAAGLIHWVGTGWCFAANAASYLAVIGGLMAMHPAELRPVAPVVREKGQIRAGLAYVRQHPPIRQNFAVLCIVSTFGLGWSVVLPVLAKVDLHGSAGTYGLLTLVMALGSLVGALWTARRAGPSEILVMWSVAIFGISSVVAALVPGLGLALVAFSVVGCFSIMVFSISNSFVQMVAEASMRGRVLAVRSMVVLGTPAIGSPISGWIADQYGARVSIGAGGVVTIVVALCYRLALSRREANGSADAVERADAVAQRIVQPPSTANV